MVSGGMSMESVKEERKTKEGVKEERKTKEGEGVWWAGR
jgi:hypothetical protein